MRIKLTATIAVVMLLTQFIGPGMGVVRAGNTGSLVGFTVDANGDKLTGACFWLFTNAGNGVRGNFVTSRCASINGRFQIDDLAPGSYLLNQIATKPGYVASNQRAVSISAGQTTRITVVNASGGKSLSVKKVDPEGTKIPGACFQVYKGQISNSSSIVSFACDGNDGAQDGFSHLYGLTVGNYTLFESPAPEGYYALSSTTSFNVAPSGSNRLTITNYPIEAPGNVIVLKQDEGTTTLAGSCFSLWQNGGGGRLGPFVTSRCDSQDGSFDGKTIIPNVAPGSYILHESRSPVGFQLANNVTFTKTDGQSRTLTVHDKPGGTHLSVRAVNSSGQALLGACWQVHRDNGNGGLGNFMTGGCDGSDGYGPNDGTWQAFGLPAGNYVLFQGSPPSGYQQASKRTFSIPSGQTDRTITVTFQRVSGLSAAEAPSATATPTATATPAASPSPVTTPEPTVSPTVEPTLEPTVEPTNEPTVEPTANPTEEPAPTETPTAEPAPADEPAQDATPETTS